MDNKEGKLCPIFSFSVGKDFPCRCLKHKCQFWTFIYSIENIQIWDCCFVLNAMKNSDGKVPV